jgi:hypothetical protein
MSRENSAALRPLCCSTTARELPKLCSLRCFSLKHQLTLLSALRTADGSVDIMPPVLIPHHRKLPANGSRTCPLEADGIPCDCDRVDVNGVHECHLNHVFKVVWGPRYRRGDLQTLDQLRGHCTPFIAQLMFELGVTLGFWPPCAYQRAPVARAVMAPCCALCLTRWVLMCSLCADAEWT